jgi:hypothetical protein
MLPITIKAEYLPFLVSLRTNVLQGYKGLYYSSVWHFLKLSLEKHKIIDVPYGATLQFMNIRARGTNYRALE